MNFEEDNLKGYDVGQVAAIYAAGRSSIYSFRTGAALVKDGEVVEIGWSHVGPIRWKKTPYSTHAEAHAIHRAGIKQAEGCKLYIANISRNGNFTMACPCRACEEFIRPLNLESINFTTPNGWGEEELSEIPYIREAWELEND